MTIALYAAIVWSVWRRVAGQLSDRTLVLAAMAAFPPFWSLILYGQISILILGAFWLGWLALERGRAYLAGVAFGMLAMLLKNLDAGGGMTAHAIAFTPKPRILKLEVTPDGEETVKVEGLSRKTRRYVAKARLTGPLGVGATVVGKQPPDLRYWLASGEVPAFVRFQGAMFLNGPVWRLEMATVDWPR